MVRVSQLCPCLARRATQDKGLKCKVNIPDTVLFRYGQLSAWWATNKVRFRVCQAAVSITFAIGPGCARDLWASSSSCVYA